MRDHETGEESSNAYGEEALSAHGKESLTNHSEDETRIFCLLASDSAKAAPELIDADEQFFRRLGHELEFQRKQFAVRLEKRRKEKARAGSFALERDFDIRRLSSRLALLHRFGVDMCLGRLSMADGAHPLYIGRVGVRAADGTQLLVDWRAPIAQPFFAATRLDPMGVVSRRRYRWDSGHVMNYWDEVLDFDRLGVEAAFDDESAFMAGLAEERSARMRDVLATIQADQDEIIRRDATGPLVVDGGPGTGKSVVALHRIAYLLYSDRHIEGAGGVLYVCPSASFARYVEDILPGLGEEGIQMATLADMLPEASPALPHDYPALVPLKTSRVIVDAIEKAVSFYEEPPTQSCHIRTPWGDVTVTPALWRDVFTSVPPHTPHNDAQDDLIEMVSEILAERLVAASDPDEHDPALIIAFLMANETLVSAVRHAWPILDSADIVADLWSVPAYLRLCAPTLSDDDVVALQRENPRAWTREDMPILDAARFRTGDPRAARERQKNKESAARYQDDMDRVIDDLIAADDSELQVMSLLRQEDAERVLRPHETKEVTSYERLAGPFGHIVVDEAQELTDSEWLMILRRCPSRSLTIVGDRAQARAGFFESWEERMARLGLGSIRQASLHINYRTPEEVMRVAEKEIMTVYPQVNVPVSVRKGGCEVIYASREECAELLRNAAGSAAVIGYQPWHPVGGASSVTPAESKGLEYDTVVVDRPSTWGHDVSATVDRYVAMTRTTRQLVICDASPSIEPPR